MALYLYQASYTSESIAAQVKHPQDRLGYVSTIMATRGIKLVSGGYSMGEYDVVAICEVDDDETMAAFALALAAGGALRAARTTKLLDGHQWISALAKAGDFAGTYKPAR
jgi:uncharacterized protein with GYD domain